MKDCRKIIEQHAGGIESNNTSPAQNLVDYEQAKLDMDILKKMIIRNNNTAEAVKKLNSTRTYRKELVVKKEIDKRVSILFCISIASKFFIDFLPHNLLQHTFIMWSRTDLIRL